MIDIHSHILPGVDDGAPDAEMSLAIARAAVEDGVTTMAATPHLSFDYPVDPQAIAPAVEELNELLRAEDVPLTVVAGAEVAISKVTELDDEALGAACLGEGRYLLVESPYLRAVSFLEDVLFDLQVRGFGIVLAHPERCPLFHDDRERLAQLVERGMLCSITAGSMAGRFGGTVRKLTLWMLAEGLVHDVASDAHDVAGRPPGLSAGFAAVERELPGLSEQADWYAREAPAALLAGGPLPPRPEAPALRGGPVRRLLRRG